jgi:hypothetical protein
MFPDKDIEKEKLLSAQTLQGELIWLRKLRLKLPQIKPTRLRTLLQQFS